MSPFSQYIYLDFIDVVHPLILSMPHLFFRLSHIKILSLCAMVSAVVDHEAGEGYHGVHVKLSLGRDLGRPLLLPNLEDIQENAVYRAFDVILVAVKTGLPDTNKRTLFTHVNPPWVL